jgi:hypothetical protein
MAEDQRVSAAAAADFVGTPDAPQLLQRAWKLGLFRLQGMRPGDSGPVEIPATEGGRVDFVSSAVGHGALFTTYRNVTVAWADVERLAQADFERELRKASTPASPPTEQAPQSASSADILEAQAGPLVQEVALELLRHFPEGRPRGLTRDKLMQCVHKKSGGKIGVFSPATLDRALLLAWPRAKRSRAPKAAKPPR